MMKYTAFAAMLTLWPEPVLEINMTVSIVREQPDSPDASALIAELDAVLTPHYPPQSRHGFSVGKLLREGVHFFVARVDGTPAACGGLLFVGEDYVEIKRMFVRPHFRGHGLAKHMMTHLEAYALAHKITLLRLETGIYQTEAIALYEKLGFVRIPPFGPYFEDPVSICYEKQLTAP
jgi:GNAT superfamily N-acetyltransferase